MNKRRDTYNVDVGGVKIGSSNPIRVQSMTNTLTEDSVATSNQIKALYDAGYSVGHIFVQGVFDEDKTKFFGVDGDRLPHEEVVWKQQERMTK